MAATKKTNRQSLRRSPRVQRTTPLNTTANSGQQSQGTPTRRATLLPTGPSTPIVRRSPRRLTLAGAVTTSKSSDANEPAEKSMSRSRLEQTADGRLDDFDGGSTKPTQPSTSAARRLSAFPEPTVSDAGDDATMLDPYAETEEKYFSMSSNVANTRLQGLLRVEFGNIEFTGKLYYESLRAKIMFTPKGRAEEEQVGRIFLHIVDKTYKRPSSTEKQWADELLLEQAEGDWASLSMALQCLYDQHGAIWPEFVKKHQHALRPTTIVYIQELRLEHEWEKKGLGHVSIEKLKYGPRLPLTFPGGDADT
ncbi:hypothetical protein LTR27_003697 [Elasticomyces elasticus]|nr:hypothetical protein LTR27_003697 [Elasticomyces elasticus]